MKVELENLKGHFKKLTVEIPAEKVALHSDDYYKRIQRDVELKGFRKGKAPINMIREVYGESSKNSIAREMVERHLQEAVKSQSLQPVNMPEINVETFSELSGLKFTATFENTPPVNLKTYKTFKTDKSEIKIEDSEVETTLTNIRGQMATFEDLAAGTTAANGLFVEMDYDASEAGKEFPGASDKGALFELGNGTLTVDFEKNVVGMKAGETKDFSVKFPQAKSEEEQTPVSGKTLEFHVSMKAVKKRILPELDDAFAAKIGPFESVKVLRERIEGDIKREKEQRRKREQLEKAVTWLIAENPVDAPESMIGHQMEQLAVEAGMQLQQMGLDEKAIEERLKTWGADMSERAVRQVKASLLLSNIAEKENIKATEEDIRNEINRMATQARKNPKDVWEDLQKKGLLYGLMRQITELKALDFIVEQST